MERSALLARLQELDNTVRILGALIDRRTANRNVDQSFVYRPRPGVPSPNQFTVGDREDIRVPPWIKEDNNDDDNKYYDEDNEDKYYDDDDDQFSVYRPRPGVPPPNQLALSNWDDIRVPPQWIERDDNDNENYDRRENYNGNYYHGYNYDEYNEDDIYTGYRYDVDNYDDDESVTSSESLRGDYWYAVEMRTARNQLQETREFLQNQPPPDTSDRHDYLVRGPFLAEPVEVVVKRLP